MPALTRGLNAYNAFSVTIARGGGADGRGEPSRVVVCWHGLGVYYGADVVRAGRPRRPLRPPGFLMLLEADLGCVLRARACLEVVVVALEAAHAGPNAVRELTDEGVVVLDGLVVAPARDADAVFCTGQFVR